MVETETKKILIATGNWGKVRELAELFQSLPVELKSLKDFPRVNEVEETGNTFEENARLKAEGYARQTGLLTLADDSGLEVAALGGAPGVFSARYAGKGASDESNIEKLLSELEKSGDFDRKARFVCEIALADSNGVVFHVENGICDGRISIKPCGDNGFGYDPIFIPDGFERTFGELNNDIKQQISHRGRAARKILQYLCGFL